MAGDVYRALRIGFAIAITLFGARIAATPIAAATPWIALTVSGSPNPAVGAVDPLTFTGSATPHGGTFHDVDIHMTLYSGYECSPVAICVVSPRWVDWTYATLSSKVTFKVHTNYLGPASLYVSSCNPEDCLNQPASTTVNPPTVSASVTYSPVGAIRTGENVRFIVHGATNVGPVGTEIRTGFSAGLDLPTALSGASWNAADRDVYGDLVLDRTGSYAFSAIVTAKLGASVKLVLDTVNDPNTQAPDATKTVSIKVGPVATPTPRPTARPTPVPTPKPSAVTPLTSPPAAVIATASPTSSLATFEASGSGEPVAQIGVGRGAPNPPSSGAAMTIDAEPAASSLIVSGALGFLAVLVIGGVMATGFVRRRR